jgi:hypothetical protein
MSLLATAFALASIAILLALGWLVTRPLPEEISLKPATRIEELLCKHTRHFPQLRQSLASANSRYVRRRASKEIERTWREERRRILESFLAGLAEDFARLDRLGRMVASLSPKFSRREEVERIWLNLRFRFNYRVMKLRIAMGGFGSMRHLARLAELVGGLSARAEAAMARLEVGAPARQADTNFNA